MLVIDHYDFFHHGPHKLGNHALVVRMREAGTLLPDPREDDLLSPERRVELVVCLLQGVCQRMPGRKIMRRCAALFVLTCLAGAGAGQPPPKPAAQNPSPMVEHTRTHPRLKEERPPGRPEESQSKSQKSPSGVAIRSRRYTTEGRVRKYG